MFRMIAFNNLLIKDISDLKRDYSSSQVIPFTETQERRINKIFSQASILLNRLDKRYTFHNINHTFERKLGVISVCYELLGIHMRTLKQEELTDFLKEAELVLIAAAFHDVGYFNKQKGHEEESYLYLFELLFKLVQDKKWTKYFSGIINNLNLNKLKELILATQFPIINPKSLNIYQAILCDADVANFGRNDFFEKGDALRKEMSNLGQSVPDYISWYKFSLTILKPYFFTRYANNLYDNFESGDTYKKESYSKTKNMYLLTEKIEELEKQK